MPRDVAGIYTLPNVPVVAGTTILDSDENSTRDDMASEFTNSLDRNGRGPMLAALRVPDGAMVTPAYSFTGEVDSGLYRKTTEEIWMAVGGVDVFGFTPTGVELAAGLDSPFIPSTEKAAVNGVASLDAAGRVPFAQISPISGNLDIAGTLDVDGISNSGQFLAPDLPPATPQYSWASEPGAGWHHSAPNTYQFIAGGAPRLQIDNVNVIVKGNLGVRHDGSMDTNYALDVLTSSAGGRGLRVRGSPGQTGNLQEWSQSSGANVANMNANGYGYMADGLGVCTVGNRDYVSVDIMPRDVNTRGLRVLSQSGQTAPLQLWSAASGGMLAQVDANGSFYAQAVDPGCPAQATFNEMKDRATSSKWVTPARMVYDRGVLKAWAVVQMDGGVPYGFGVSAIEIPTTGHVRVTWAFSATNALAAFAIPVVSPSNGDNSALSVSINAGELYATSNKTLFQVRDKDGNFQFPNYLIVFCFCDLV
jgi:hypothetical protein